MAPRTPRSPDGSGAPGPAALAGPLQEPADLDPLMARIGDARHVLLGEASHGTHEFYRWRTAITRRLVEEHGFTIVAVEGDWPDCAMIDRWVRHRTEGDDRSAEEVLAGFRRWPTWMWANEEVAELITWLRQHNAGCPDDRRVGFSGLDVYSLWDSLREVMGYLQQHEPGSVDAARQAIRCFEPYREDPQAYAWASRVVPDSCEDAVVALLQQVLADRAAADGERQEDRFVAEQNAEVARNAERYYRAMVRGGPQSWNIRDVHMVDTLDRLMAHRGPEAKAVVWAHNTHVGDARATDMADHGMVNVGQLVRERQAPDDVVVVGFSGHHGTVIAGDSWGAPMARMEVPDARPGSLEDLLHQEVGRDALLVFPDRAGGSWLEEYRPHRAIGVVYDPRRERAGNYVPTVLGRRYDALLAFDRTTALRPLGQDAPASEELETAPFGV